MIAAQREAIRKFRRKDRDFQYIAAQLGGPFDPLPHWFQLLVPLGLLRFDSEHNVEVMTITGQWRQVEQGDWVVLQKGDDTLGYRVNSYSVWHVEHEDFIKLWEEL